MPSSLRPRLRPPMTTRRHDPRTTLPVLPAPADLTAHQTDHDPVPMDQHFITRIVEAALLAANQPLSIVQLRGLFTLDEPSPEGGIEQALTDLRAGCEGRGIELAETASGYRFQVQADVHAWVARLWTERQTKYTRATLETLAIIAYRQPITRGEIEQVRGVAVSSNIIKALEEREWIRVIGHRDVPGRPELLGTSRGFLDYFGLKSLDQLPPLSELKDFGELDPQLSFVDPDAPKPAPIIAGISDGAEGDADGEEAGDDDSDAHSPDNNSDQDIPDDGTDADIAQDAPLEHDHDDAAPASDDTHTALVADDDSTGA
jgi:segregation and condensation protein B